MRSPFNQGVSKSVSVGQPGTSPAITDTNVDPAAEPTVEAARLDPADAPAEGSDEALALQRLTQGPQGLSYNEFRAKYDNGQDSLWSLVGLEEADGTVTAKEVLKAGGFQPLSRDLRSMRPSDRTAAMNMLDREAQQQLQPHLPKAPPPPPAVTARIPPQMGPPAPTVAPPIADAPVEIPAGFKAAPTAAQIRAGEGLMKRGMAGDSVRDVQRSLIESGHLAPTNARGGSNARGVFDLETKNAVQAFQRANGLGPDGVVGPATLGKLQPAAEPEVERPTTQRNANVRADPIELPAGYTDAPDLEAAASGDALIKRGMGGESVRTIQRALIDSGHLAPSSAAGKPNADGVFGGGTKQAVQRFQRANGLSPDGVVGEDTVAKLFPTGVPDRLPAGGDAAVSDDDAPASPNADRELYLPELENFEPGVYGRGTREVEVQQARLQKRIDATDDPAEKERLQRMHDEWEACSFHTTRRAAEIAGVSYGRMLEETGDPSGVGREGFGAWHKRGVVLDNGGESVWQRGEGPVSGAYDDIQVGDFVSLGNGRMSKHTKRYDDLAFEEGVRHSGVVVGRNKDGVPIVEHNFAGEVYREPINDLSRSPLHYRAISVFRAEPFTDTDAVRTRHLDAERATEAKRQWQDAGAFTGAVQLDDADERHAVNEYVSAYQDVRREFGEEYGISPEHADRTFQDLIAIGVQESNFDNAIVRSTDDGVLAAAGDAGKQWFTDDTMNPLHWAARETVRGARNYLATVSEEEAAENRAYNEEHGLLPDVAGWRKEIEVANLMEADGLTYEAAAQQVNARYGRPEHAYTPSSLKSRGTFKIKDVPEQVRIAFDGADNLHYDTRFGDRFYKDARGNILAGMGLYERNYDKAREVFPEHTLPAELGWGPEEKDAFYRSIARIAHNAPTKAFNREFVDFFVAPVISGPANDPNPDRGRFNVDYDARVRGYRDEIWGP